MKNLTLISCILLCLFVYSTIQDTEKEQDKQDAIEQGVFDTKTEKFHPWTKSGDQCSSYDVGYAAPGNSPPVLFGVDPGHKYAYALQLIQNCLGIYTSKIRKMVTINNFQKKFGFYGFTHDPFDGSTLAQKTNFLDFLSNNFIEKYVGTRYQQAILLINDPLKQLATRKMKGSNVSYLKYMSITHPENNKATVKKLTKDAKNWITSIKNLIQSTRTSKQNPSSNLFVINYADLVTSTPKVLKEVGQYLKKEVDPKRLQCAVNYFNKIQQNNQNNKKLQKQKKRELKMFKMVKNDIKPVQKVLNDGIKEINQLLLQGAAAGAGAGGGNNNKISYNPNVVRYVKY